MFTAAGKALTGLFPAAVLLLGSCASPPADNATLAPRGAREPLRTGHWRGAVGPTMVDFFVNGVAGADVAIRIYGSIMRQANRSMEKLDISNSFVDRPRTCKRSGDGKTFDCTRYADMHIDNSLLCGEYRSPGETFHFCLPPAR
ncbi:MAG TPA: hypothetical protein VET89_09205 [Stellaceae bacterium]|nr:hypothetical protein [Stellaceae bacterium]